MIADVRTRTRAALTFASNWDRFEELRFWDALDCIGIQAYFPLADGADPSRAVLRDAWNARMRKLRRFAISARRNIVFTELGYNRSRDAARKPWAYETDGPETEALQARCLSVALDAIEGEGSVLGSFLWKWFPGERAVGRNFQLATPKLLEAIEGVWRR